jgi:hypothetical protein
MHYIGIDNGVTGSIAILNEERDVRYFGPMPVRKCLNYTKTKAWVHRIDYWSLWHILEDAKSAGTSKCVVERPMVNPGRFKATVSALRALEATQIVLEDIRIPYEFIDSRSWQKVLLPHGIEKEELKIASDQVCKRLFPTLTIKHPGDGDSLLIAEYARRLDQKPSLAL